VSYYEVMWKNVVEPDMSQTVTEYSVEYMRFSCRITKALIIDNIYCFSLTTIATQ